MNRKFITISILMVFIIGICTGFYGSTITSKEFNFPNTCITDTINTTDTIMCTDTIVKFPNSFTTNKSNISIDTITTVINGEETNSNIKVNIININDVVS